MLNVKQFVEKEMNKEKEETREVDEISRELEMLKLFH
jgi:hypothetical protein